MIIPLAGSGMVQLTLIVSDERGSAVTPVGGDGAEEREHIVHGGLYQLSVSRSTCGMYMYIHV